MENANAKDFRLNNFLVDQSTGLLMYINGLEPDKVLADYVMANMSEDVYKASRPAPIELTIDWILKFGFFSQNSLWHKKGVHVGVLDDGTFLYLPGKSIFGEHGRKLKYVHELQNLYFYLTTEELFLDSLT